MWLQISMTYYEGGHMMYADIDCLKQMTADIEAFYGKLVRFCLMLVSFVASFGLFLFLITLAAGWNGEAARDR